MTYNRQRRTSGNVLAQTEEYRDWEHQFFHCDVRYRWPILLCSQISHHPKELDAFCYDSRSYHDAASPEFDDVINHCARQEPIAFSDLNSALRVDALRVGRNADAPVTAIGGYCNKRLSWLHRHILVVLNRLGPNPLFHVCNRFVNVPGCLATRAAAEPGSTACLQTRPQHYLDILYRSRLPR